MKLIIDWVTIKPKNNLISNYELTQRLKHIGIKTDNKLKAFCIDYILNNYEISKIKNFFEDIVNMKADYFDSTKKYLDNVANSLLLYHIYEDEIIDYLEKKVKKNKMRLVNEYDFWRFLVLISENVILRTQGERHAFLFRYVFCNIILDLIADITRG